MAQSNITRLLSSMQRGDRDALDRVLPLVYTELQTLARHHLRSERPDHTLSTTALVHEAYLKLVNQDRAVWQNRGHFFAVASMAMRRILVNHARDRGRAKRGGGAEKLSLDAGLDVADAMSDERAQQIVVIDQLLHKLAEINERAARVVECRFFGGLSIDETCKALGVAPMTVKRDWRLAKAWLRRELDSTDPG